jgi:hypothetical protein
MEKNDFSKLMDQVIERKLLPGNCAQEPRKQVRIMVCADFEDSCIPGEKVKTSLLQSISHCHEQLLHAYHFARVLGRCLRPQ